MSTLEDLRDAVQTSLETRGVLGEMQARLRSEIFRCIDDRSLPPPKLTNENLMINELIREYLEWNGYRHTSSVLLQETGQPSQGAMSRDVMDHELNLPPAGAAAAQLPLLYRLVECRKARAGPDDVRPPVFSEDDRAAGSGAARREPQEADLDDWEPVLGGQPATISFTNNS